MNPVNPTHSVLFQGMRMNTYHANTGEGLPRHEHEYPHLTICLMGSCQIRKENRQVMLTPASKPVYLLENEWHELEALEDKTVFCNVFAEGKY